MNSEAMQPSPFLRDLIYFDVARVSSLYSQVRGGLLKEFQSTTEATTESKDVVSGDLVLVKSEMAETRSRRSARVEMRVPHHAVLQDLEDALFELGVALDLNESVASESADVAQLHARLQAVPYVRCEGYTFLEDFGRLREITERFVDLNEFIATSIASETLASDPEGQRLTEELGRAQLEVATTSEGPRQDKARRRATDLYLKRRERILALADLEETPSWLIEGIQLWIDMFTPGRISLRVFPLESKPELQVIANLKRELFLDSDLSQFRYAYGSEPDVPLTVIGLITSIPPRVPREFSAKMALPQPDDDEVPATDDAEDATDEEREEAFEKAFRAMFPATEGLERFIRFARYPSVTIAPLAIYRRLPVASGPAEVRGVGWRERLHAFFRG